MKKKNELKTIFCMACMKEVTPPHVCPKDDGNSPTKRDKPPKKPAPGKEQRTPCWTTVGI